MIRISEIAVTFAKIDGIADDNVPQLDKLLRNMTQRHYLPPSGRDGRADLYSLETTCVMRLAERMEAFGVQRHVLDNFLRFMQSAPTFPTRFKQGDGFTEALSRIEEAVERAQAGEDFTVGLELTAAGLLPQVNFDQAEIDEDARKILASVERQRTPDAVLTLNAGRLIREIIAMLAVE